MKFYRGLVDLISHPTKAKIFLIIMGFASGIWIYSKVYQYKHSNHSLLGIIISVIPLIIILSLMGDVSEESITDSKKENSLPMIIGNKPHRHNMYEIDKKQEPIPQMIESVEIIETADSITRRRKRVFYGSGDRWNS